MRSIAIFVVLFVVAVFAGGAVAQEPPSITTNADWTPLVQEFDGVPMVLIPPGCFMMGSDHGGDEEPITEICFDEPFWLDQTEVTNAQFAEFGGEASREPCASDEPNHPRDCIKWPEADAFCTLRDVRLPTEPEWEYAARGPDGWAFPWGDEFDGTLLNFCDANCTYAWRTLAFDDGYELTSPVDAFPEGASWVGAYDLSGNLWEWTSTLYMPYPYDPAYENPDDSTSFRALRGGSYDDDAGYLRAAHRTGFNPAWAVEFHGFRCARTFDETDLSDDWWESLD